MKIHHATSILCATILLSLAAALYYGYHQGQYIINSNSQFVSIFDRKNRTLNICDKVECRMMAPEFETRLPARVAQGMMSFAPQPEESRILGSASQQNMMAAPQMSYPQQQMPQPQMAAPQMGYPQQMQPQMAAPMDNNQMAAAPQMDMAAQQTAMPQQAIAQ